MPLSSIPTTTSTTSMMLRLSPMRMTAVFTVVLIALVGHGGGFSFVTGASSSPGTPQARADEYRELLELTEDKDGLESIRAIHEQLDDDHDGTIEPSETGDFIRVDLHPESKHQQQLRQKNFHKKDSEITVKDLWNTWWKSEVHNWTVEVTIEWLTKNCELPQYAENFRKHSVTGSKLPLIAVGGSFLSKHLGITNPIHRSKITLKAMDVVLFGPPKESSSMLKDVILSTLLVLAVTGFIYAYRQNKRSREHLEQMIIDMESLSQAERTLQEMQAKLSLKDNEIDLLHHQNNLVQNELPDALEVSRLKEEVEVLRHELQRAEVELEDKCWVAPPVLQHWLQLTYEIESAVYNVKRKTAEEQLEMAKDMCERLKKKRSSLVGAFVSTHGRSIDDVDRSILEAKTALLEVTKDLQERTARWRQIEMLCGCSIMHNPGIAVLQNLVRHVGVGRVTASGGRIGGSRMSGSMSQEDLLADDNIDAHSVAASSSHMTSFSGLQRPSKYPGSSAASVSGLSIASIQKRRHVPKPLSRESSKESSSSDEQTDKKAIYQGVHHSPGPSSMVGTPPLPATRKITPKIGPNGKMMVKSYSQDASSNMAAMASAAVASSATSSTQNVSTSLTAQSIASSVSDTHISLAASLGPAVLTSKPPLPQSSNSSSVASINPATASPPTKSEGLSTSASSSSLRPPTVEEESYSAASDSGSLASELDASGKKEKKKRSFFNFRKKKEKIP